MVSSLPSSSWQPLICFVSLSFAFSRCHENGIEQLNNIRLLSLASFTRRNALEITPGIAFMGTLELHTYHHQQSSGLSTKYFCLFSSHMIRLYFLAFLLLGGATWLVLQWVVSTCHLLARSFNWQCETLLGSLCVWLAMGIVQDGGCIVSLSLRVTHCIPVMDTLPILDRSLEPETYLCGFK